MRKVFTAQEEYEANEFAMAFLMPKNEFLEIAEKYLENNIYDCNKIAEYFDVELHIAIKRGQSLGIFSYPY